MEEAIPGVPGAYPGTPADESGPAPSPAPRQDASSHRHHHHRHEQHEHNKLHKSGDPRGHRHTDSGVGLVDSQPIYPSSVDQTTPRAFSENTTAPTAPAALPYESKHSAAPHESNYTHASLIDRTEEPVQKSAPEPVLEPAQAPTVTKSEDAHSKHGNKTRSGNTTPPYWGNLPKSMKGGIYNTVMGHGSAGDDHDQHHGLPQRAAPDRGHITGPTDELLSGGVYNTVAGHGSQDEESRRHATSHLATEDTVSQPVPSTLQAAPLPGIAEDKPFDHVATETGRSDIARGFLPETAVRDDVALATAAAATSQAHREPQRSSADRGSHGDSSTSGPNFAATHRAFPLSSSPDRTHRRSQEGPVPEETQQTVDSHSNRDAIALAAGAGAAGTALAASEQKDKRNKLKKQKEPSPSPKSRHRSKDETIDRTDKIVTTSSPPRHSHDKDTSRSERKSSDEGSSTSEKKHHGILGIFHRRKDSKGQADRKPSEKEVVESNSEESSHHSSHKKEKAAVAATAAGAGAHHLSHRHKDEEKPKDQRSSSEPMARRSEETKRRSRRMSGNQSAAAAVAESAGAFGVLYQKPQEKDFTERQGRKSVDTGAPPAPPERSPKRRSLTPPSSMAFTAETAHTAPSTAQGSQSYGAVQSHDNSAKHAAAGVAAGLGASVFANKKLQSQQESNPSDLTQPQTSTVPFTYENPRDPPPTPANAAAAKSQDSPTRSPKSISHRASEVVTNEPGNYNTLASGTASGIRGSTVSSSDDAATRSSDAYNHLPSGTSSGIKGSDSSDAGAYSASKCEDRAGDDEYNHLASGTPSGVKIGSRTSRSSATATEPESHSLSKHGDGQYNILPSGTSSGMYVNQQKAPVHTEMEPQAAKHSLVAAPMPSHHESKPSELTAFPSPEQAHKMSPEVLPDSYRAQSHATPATDRTVDARTQRAQEMSPEVLPDSYREQSHPAPSTDRAPAPAKSHASAVDPALAAATGAWAGKTASSSGPAMDQSRVMHKCEYCGRDNDISSQFTKENMAKMTKKQGSTGNWWQDAWSSA